MALVVNPELIKTAVMAFYNAYSTREKPPAMAPMEELTQITVTPERMMLVGPMFPVDFIIHPADQRRPEDVSQQNVNILVTALTSLVGADHLRLGIVDALSGEDKGVSLEIVGDKVIANALTMSIGEDDAQPVRRSEVRFVEHPPEGLSDEPRLVDTSDNSVSSGDSSSSTGE